jgi:hypothetical protein
MRRCAPISVEIVGRFEWESRASWNACAAVRLPPELSYDEAPHRKEAERSDAEQHCSFATFWNSIPGSAVNRKEPDRGKAAETILSEPARDERKVPGYPIEKEKLDAAALTLPARAFAIMLRLSH